MIFAPPCSRPDLRATGPFAMGRSLVGDAMVLADEGDGAMPLCQALGVHVHPPVVRFWSDPPEALVARSVRTRTEPGVTRTTLR